MKIAWLDADRWPWMLALAVLGMWLPAAVDTAAAPPRGPRVELLVGHWQPGEKDEVDPPASPLKSPFGVDFDAGGNLFIVELEGGRVHRLDADGHLQQIAGDGSQSYRGDGGPARQATFNGMHNVAVTPDGDVLIADSWNHCIRKIDRRSGKISTLAGTGRAGFAGDGGAADKALFNFVMCITLNQTGEKVYVADLKNRRIRVVDLQSGLVRTVAGNGQRGVPRDGALAVESPLVDPRAVASDSRDNIYILERGGHAVRQVDAAGRIRTVAGTGQAGYRDGPAGQAQFHSPKHLCVDDQDRLIVADDQNRAIRRYDPRQATVSTILGRGVGRPPVQLSRPHGVCFSKGHVIVVDTGHHRILKLSGVD